MKYGAVILAGGQSRRMGRDKSQLKLDGVCFLDRLAEELGGFGELIVSVDDEKRHPGISYPMVSDKYPECGPMSGLFSALQECSADALVVVPCDVPLFSREMAERLCAELKEGTDAVIVVTEDGRRHPLCGIYRKSCAGEMKRCLDGQNYRMQSMLKGLRVRTYEAGGESWRLNNINTPEEFQRLSGHEGAQQPFSAVRGQEKRENRSEELRWFN